MNCGNCTMTDGYCYTSMPPKVKCTVTGRYHFYDDECDCETLTRETKTRELESLKNKLNGPGQLAIDYDATIGSTDNTISREEAELAYTSLEHLTLNGETAQITLADKLCDPAYEYCTSCLVCGEDIPISWFGDSHRVCTTCKKAIMYIKEKFKEEIDRYEV